MGKRLISYDLSKPGRDYERLFEAIKALGSWWHCLESVWVVKTDLTCAQVRDHLVKHIDANDKLAVLELGSGWASQGLDKNCNDCLRNNM